MEEQAIVVKDLIDFKEFQQLMDEFYSLTGVPIGIADSSDNFLVGSNMDCIHENTVMTLKHAEAEDNYISFGKYNPSLSAAELNTDFTCERISKTIFIEEKHVATIFLSPFAEKVDKTAKPFYTLNTQTKNITEIEKREIIKSNSIFSKEQLDKIISFVSTIAKIISELINTNYRLQSEINQNIEQQNQLLAANNKVEQSDNLKNEFLRNMSHEVRTPLNGIIGFTELLVLDRSNEKIEIYKEHIQNSAFRLLEIMENIIAYSKIQTGDIELTNSKTNIQEIIDQVMMKYESKALQRKNRLVQIEKSETVNIELLVDAAKLARVLELVIDNAIKFTFDGIIEFGGYICGKEKNKAVIFIKDNGIGIPESEQKNVFEPFRQVETGFSRLYGGNGLGLSITKEYIDAMGGTVKLTSFPEFGTKVIITVPIEIIRP
jgi:signal transduction histidine kinase